MANRHAHFVTSQGEFRLELFEDKAPITTGNFIKLAESGYYNNLIFHRVIDGFMVQFGFSSDPQVNMVWKDQSIMDDKVTQTNDPGMLTFANRGPNTRSTQFFINTGHNTVLDDQGFAPIGKVLGDGMEVVAKLYSGYGEGAPRGSGPSQGRILNEGGAYLKKNFPHLDYIVNASLVGSK